ncbi:MAG: hypothetical protein PHE09_14205 [Oscillospiraceae bacterium]|nr:hypothetical protein [Oscillospiraceae bacterium]
MKAETIERDTAVAMFFCDIWKSTGSMRLQGIFTNREKLNSAIRTAKKEKEIELDNGNIRDLRSWDIKTINNNFQNLYVEEYCLNEKE